MSEENAEPEEEAPLPAFIIEGARSGRAKCKSCRRPIPKDSLRLGVLVEGPFGAGHMWYHLTCAAKRMYPKVEQAYADEAWKNAKVVPEGLPDLAELEKLREEAEKQQAEKKEPPYVELAPSGRSRCKLCDELIEQGKPRVVIGRKVEFGQQVRTTPINVHPACVADGLHAEDSATEVEGFEEALRANSKGVEAAVIDAALAEVGPLF